MATPFATYKLIILYMLQHTETSLSSSQISEYVLEQEYMDYFQLQQVLSELLETEFVEKQKKSNRSYYKITEEGKTTLAFFEEELSEDIRNEIREYLKLHGCEEREIILTPADYYETPNGSYAVSCRLIEKNKSLFDLNMSVPSQEAAETICRKWKQKSQEVYAMIMEELL